MLWWPVVACDTPGEVPVSAELIATGRGSRVQTGWQAIRGHGRGRVQPACSGGITALEGCVGSWVIEFRWVLSHLKMALENEQWLTLVRLSWEERL